MKEVLRRLLAAEGKGRREAEVLEAEGRDLLEKAVLEAGEIRRTSRSAAEREAADLERAAKDEIERGRDDVASQTEVALRAIGDQAERNRATAVSIVVGRLLGEPTEPPDPGQSSQDQTGHQP